MALGIAMSFLVGGRFASADEPLLGTIEVRAAPPEVREDGVDPSCQVGSICGDRCSGILAPQIGRQLVVAVTELHGADAAWCRRDEQP